MHVAVIGLGRMGSGIARRLGDTCNVTGFDIEAVPDLADAVHLAAHLAAACEGADVLVTVLPSAKEVADVLPIALHGLPQGALWIDMTSSDPAAAALLHGDASRSGVDSVASPMLGGPQEAASGGLRFYVSGRSRAVRRAQDVLAPLSGTGWVRQVSDSPADAYLVKLLGNLLWFGQVVATTEALLLGKRAGLHPSTLHNLLKDGPGSSRFLVQDMAKLLAGDMMTDFGLDGVVQELRHLEVLADEQALPFTLSRVVAQVHASALADFGPQPGELLASRWLQLEAGTRLDH